MEVVKLVSFRARMGEWLKQISKGKPIEVHTKDDSYVVMSKREYDKLIKPNN